MKSRVVFGLNCMNCTASYIGVTTRVLPARGLGVWELQTYSFNRPQHRLE